MMSQVFYVRSMSVGLALDRSFVLVCSKNDTAIIYELPYVLPLLLYLFRCLFSLFVFVFVFVFVYVFPHLV